MVVRRPLQALAAAVLLTAFPLGLAACGGDDEASSNGTLTVYSGREEEIVAPLLERFEQESGVELEVRYGDSAELAATIAEEGDNSPADVFFAQDPGSLGAVEGEDLLAQLPDDLLDQVDVQYRDPDGTWVGTSGRARVVAYNTGELKPAQLPDTIWAFTDPRWKGRIGFPPTNASFQAFVTAMRLSAGDERTREWLEGIESNNPRFYEKNSQAVEAVAAGEIDAAFVNHYYLYLVKEEQPDAPVANHFLRSGDPGALVSVAGAGILESTDNRDDAERFIDFLLSEEGQRFYAEEATEAEYPLIDGVEPRPGLPPLAELHGPDIQLDALGAELERTLELLSEVGFTT